MIKSGKESSEVEFRVLSMQLNHFRREVVSRESEKLPSDLFSHRQLTCITKTLYLNDPLPITRTIISLHAKS